MHKRLHSYTFFLFGVVVGLSIREVLVRSGPHIFLPSDIEPWKTHLEALRVIVFLLTITCFYFGAGTFFDKVYLDEDTAAKFSKKSYGLDFGLGLAHFLIFFGWSLTVADHSRLSWGVSPFLGFLSAVLLYDLVWLVVNLRHDSLQEIKLWTFMCFVTFLLGGVVFFVVRAFSNNDVISEECAFVVVALYILGDFTELVSGKPFFSELIKKVLPRS